MTSFLSRFPELAAREIRSIRLLEPMGPLPAGDYGFLEFYCDDDACDCRRVVLQVREGSNPERVQATINYGWESVEFYAAWLHGDRDGAREIAEASLDPLNPQGEGADLLLALFQDLLRSDRDYVARLAQHYALCKSGADAPASALAGKASEAFGVRSQPETDPGFVELNNLMREGYAFLETCQSARACDVWLRAWDRFRELYRAGGYDSLSAFDARFQGVQFVSNWVQDLEMELDNAGRKDARYYEHRIRYAGEYLTDMPAAEDLLGGHMRRAIAESWAALGQRARSDTLFEQWLRDDPQWVWGWIGWADTYWDCRKPERDGARAAQILERGLAVVQGPDRAYLIERLANVFEEQGRAADAAALRQRIARQEAPDAAPSGSKVGRNEPCPCGSGLKYKRCCGRD